MIENVITLVFFYAKRIHRNASLWNQAIYISSRQYVIIKRENALHYNNLLYSIVTLMEHIGLVGSCIKKANNDGMIVVNCMKYAR